MIQGSLFTFVKFDNKVTKYNNFYYFLYSGFEYRYDKRHGTFTRSDGQTYTRSCTATKPLLRAMEAQKAIEQAKTEAEKQKAIRRADSYRLPPEVHAERVREYKNRHSKPKTDSLPVRGLKFVTNEGKTRQTSKGIEIKVGNMLITVKDPAKVEAVRERFEKHEREKFKNL